ncbi:MAG: 30S ribosomal protein S2 [Planctomycetes bacterium GWF2_41_51]|nr:MAG: 30S ribosomal protein S2 [Planctomycetes bacterium GWF2_41_51]
MANDLARNLISAGVHFGHTVSRWNPKTKPYVYSRRGMVHIINVRETLKGVILAQKLLKDIVSSGKDVVFVGTKRQAQKAVKAAAEATGMHYVINRWLGGTLTNFRTINSRIRRLDELEAMANDGSIESESKKRASTLKRELRKMKSNLEGIRKMNQIPGVIFVVDVRREVLALREAKKMGVPTIGIIDTDSDPDLVDIPIPANDDSVKGIGLIINELIPAVAEAKTMQRAFSRDDDRKPKVRRRSLTRADEGGAEGAEEKAETSEA